MKINLGCGFRKEDGFINIDNRSEVKPDIVADATYHLPFKDNSIKEVRANDFLEHIPIGKTVFVIEEIYRVLKDRGIFNSFTPSSEGRGAFQDPTHVSFWNQNSWFYYMYDEYRNLYGIKAKFLGKVQDMVTSPELKIIHTRAQLFAVKS